MKRSIVDFFALKSANDGIYPVIRYGDGNRAILGIVGKPNAKGMIKVSTIPDLMDNGVGKVLTLWAMMPSSVAPIKKLSQSKCIKVAPFYCLLLS